MATPDAAHFTMVANALADGDVVAFLGAGVNRCGRPAGAPWKEGRYLPDGRELSRDLVDRFGYPRADEENLARVAQYVALMAGDAPLYRRLRDIFGGRYPTTPLHELLAALPRTLRERGRFTRCPLVVTTNYDDLVERAFATAEEPLDVVVFAPREGRAGLFDLLRDGGAPQPVESPDELLFALERRTVLLKIHGVVGDDADCVITEDDYIEYLALGDMLSQLPKQLSERLRNANFLFLGYGMADWNIRAMLRRIQREQRRGWSSWAVQLGPDQFDERLWTTRDVYIFDVALDAYIAALAAALAALRPR